MLGVKNLEIIPAHGEERIEPGLSPAEVVSALSRDKARQVAATCDFPCVVIGADTVVALDGEILGKPKDESDAVRMLRALSGREHRVFTGLTIIAGEKELQETEVSTVRFREMSEHEITVYVKTGESMDKAGAYGAQGLGALFVKGIDGDFFNVMGLPICRLALMLKKLGIELL